MWKAMGVSVLCCCCRCVWAEVGTLAVFELNLIASAVSGGGGGEPERNIFKTENLNICFL